MRPHRDCIEKKNSKSAINEKHSSFEKYSGNLFILRNLSSLDQVFAKKWSIDASEILNQKSFYLCPLKYWI